MKSIIEWKYARENSVVDNDKEYFGYSQQLPFVQFYFKTSDAVVNVSTIIV